MREKGSGEERPVLEEQKNPGYIEEASLGVCM